MILPYEIRLDINSLSVTYEARSTIMTILRYCSILSDTRYCLLSHNCFTHLHCSSVTFNMHQISH